MKTERRYPYDYTRVQHLQPEDYPARREFCTWLLNLQVTNPNFVSRILFSDESIFGRQGCYDAHNWHIWVEENPHAIFSRAFQERFSINLWVGLQQKLVYMSSNFSLLVGPFEFPTRLTGDIYSEFLNANFPICLTTFHFFFVVTASFNTMAHHHTSVDKFEKFWINSILIDG
jgi:hypothetical protein